MTDPPAERPDVSKIGLLIGVALIGVGGYVLVSYLRSGGHGLTALRGLAAIPVGVAAIVLSLRARGG